MGEGGGGQVKCYPYNKELGGTENGVAVLKGGANGFQS